MKITRRRLLAGTFATASALAVPNAGNAAVFRRIEGRAFGTNWRLTLPGASKAQDIAAGVADLLEQLEECLSPFRSGSELSSVNRDFKTKRQLLSPPLAQLMKRSLAIAEMTNGAFDPTLGPEVARYGFGPINNRVAPQPRTTIGYRGLRVDGSHLTKIVPALTFDPCGAGKGYALDRLADHLRTVGMTDFLFEFGGDVLACGNADSRRHWRIGIATPRPGVRAPMATIALSDGALATSGDTINSYAVNGKRYCHIIDPVTAAPVDNAIASVSVIAANATLADGLATAFMVMGVKRGCAFAEKHKTPCLFVTRSRNHLLPRMAAGFERYLVNRT